MMKKHCSIILSVLCTANLFAQNDSDLSATILDYFGKLPQEKIYVHTDKSVYTPGDTVWFRAYVLDAATNTLADRSKFVYVELLDNRADTLVMRKKIKETAAADNDSTLIFANAMPLPKHLKDGDYTLTAYTQWMRNFGESGFYKKQLQIVNNQTATHTETLPLSAGAGGLSLRLFPEGGNLLAGINQRLAYKAVGADGLGVDVSVHLINEHGETRQEGHSQHLGMGDLLVFVAPGERLFLEAATDDGRTARAALPEALTHGATLAVTQRSGHLFIQPQATPDFPLANLQILIYGAGNLLQIGNLSPTSPVRIPLADLRPGVLNIALVNPTTKQVHAERLAFVRQN